MEHEDRTEGQRAIAHQAGNPYGSVYVSDMMQGRFSQGVEGANPLPTQRYTQTAVERIRMFPRVFAANG